MALSTAKMREYMRGYRDRRREIAFAKIGNKCQSCGAKENLEFDHIKPSTKTMTIAKMWTASMKKFLEELEKCQVLCRSCHLNKSRSEGSFSKSRPARHGKLWMYMKYKCRCSACSNNYRAYFRNRRSHRISLRT